jgi:hypothetical protein
VKGHCFAGTYSVVTVTLGEVYELGLQHITDTDIVNAAMKQKGEDDGGEHESEAGQSSEHVSHSMALLC